MNETRYIVAGSLIDGLGGSAHKRALLTVRDGRIAAIGSATDCPRGEGAAVDDLSHCTLVPPLVDGSVALAHAPSLDPRAHRGEGTGGNDALLIARHLRDCHDHGVLGLADSTAAATPPEAEGLVTLRSCGRLLRREDGTLEVAAAGDFLRIDSTGDIDADTPPSPGLDRQVLGRLLNQWPAGKTVVVANGALAVGEALAAGCDAIEQGYLMGEANLRLMARDRVRWIPSVLRAKNGLDCASSGGSVCCRFSLRAVGPGEARPGAEASWRAMLADQLAQLRLARSLGVLVAVGTGAGSPGILHGESMVEEMKLFLRAGWSLEETLHCASEQGARFFGMDNLGALAVGRPATFLVARGMPQQLPRKLAYLEGIYIAGRPSAAYRKNPIKVVHPQP
ncbi:MAG: amidohydrolase family protein [Desulfobulbus sp.]|jgi:imidazolonepropionase-like amidohydrolase|nr:amidohydrolase family protein [Desulfobulbus sp.]